MDIHQVDLPSSKSISNRLLIIQALGQLKTNIKNLSDSDDTLNLQKALQNNDHYINIGEGGTTLRFLLAYFCWTEQNKVLDGMGNLRTRPLLPLIHVLEQLGCEFQLDRQTNFLPIKIMKGIDKEYTGVVHIDSNISSQFVSSILLMAPCFHSGLKVCWSSQGVSEPYIFMTLQLMQQFGIQCSIQGNCVDVKPGSYMDRNYTVEADWSAAAFMLSWMALQEQTVCFFPYLKRSGLQADEVLIDFLNQFGITSLAKENGLLVAKNPYPKPKHIAFDFTNCPDLFPALAIFCALQNVDATFRGLQHLVHKESNRLQIITDFLNQCHVRIQPHVNPHEIHFNMQSFQLPEAIQLDSHQDHRIAMAFSLLHKLTNVSISNAQVVTKSFPNYWEEFALLRRYTA